MARDAPRWHPLLAAQEGPVGTWRMIDSLGTQYGLIRLVRLNGEPRYRTEFRGVLLGYGGSLSSSCERIHHALVAAAAPGGRIGWESLEAAARRARPSAQRGPDPDRRASDSAATERRLSNP